MQDNNNNDTSLLAAKLGALHEDVSEIKAALTKLSDAITKLVTVALDVATAAMMIVAARHVTPDSWSGLRLAVYSPYATQSIPCTCDPSHQEDGF
jgi:hypothetical protein